MEGGVVMKTVALGAGSGNTKILNVRDVIL
jgi:hypothetical protein